MAGKTLIEDPKTGNLARVTERGQLITAPLEYSEAYNVQVALTNTAYNFIAPKQGKRFVITDILLYANRDVAVTDATVVIYEATSASTTTVTKTLLSIEMPKNSHRDIVGLNLITNEGVWLNIKTDDNTIFSNLMGYYVDV